MSLLKIAVPAPQDPTFLVVPQPVRINYNAVLKYGDIYLAAQRTMGGTSSWVTSDGIREIVFASASPGLFGCFFYRSFTGKDGKKQGTWYPVGGVYSGTYRGSDLQPIWVIKGDSENDPYYGRYALGRLMERVNTSLPHSDEAVDRWLQALGISSHYELASRDAFAIVPTIIDTTTTLKNESRKHTVLELWKENGLNKSFGQRNEDTTRRHGPEVKPVIYYA